MAPSKRTNDSSDGGLQSGTPLEDDDSSVPDPDFIEEPQADEIDNIVPTRGYQMMPMVGLGGSAGSIAALQEFFKAMPPDSGMVFVVILHLSPEHHSTMPELLQRVTAMKVVEAHDSEKVHANTVYVIPPGKFLSTVDGHLRLVDMEREKGRRVAVDLFFRSLADTHGPHAAAIVLSGADGDGAIGIKRIKERGGLTIAQDPDEAEYGSMPRTAIDTGMVDWVLRISDMPRRLQAYQRNEKVLRLPPEEGPQPAGAPPANPNEQEAALRDVLAFLRTRTGRDFSYYKRATILRRISRRMQVNAVEDMPAYLEFLRTHLGESGALLQDLLISVTNFFRDREAFEALETHVPGLFEGKTQSDMVRVWVPACATGEEAYSIAMLLLEHARRLDVAPSLQVFACDLDEDAIRQARGGFFPDAITADVSEERLLKFFVKEPHGYRVRRELREMVLFASHDLLKDPPFSRMDLVSCRNLLIYLNGDAQTRALEIFHFALRPSGRLFLGSSESVDGGRPLFQPLDKKHRIYARRAAARHGLPMPSGASSLSRMIHAPEGKGGPAPVLPPPSFLRRSRFTPDSTPSGGAEQVSLGELHFKLLERMAPPSILVDADHTIVHLSESAGRFLKFGGGELTANLLLSVSESLRAELRSALFRAAERNETAESFDVPTELEEERRVVDIRVAPAGDFAPGFFLVTLHAREPHIPGAAETKTESPSRSNVEPVVRHLERELAQVKGRLRSTIEQHEAGTEELKSSNEELQAMNEELRSASEELETSREELQSINEELTTVNHELKVKLDELGQVNSDLQNLMAATSIATVFLDRNLRIMRFTPPAVALFRLIPGDLGRPLADLRHRLDYPDLNADAESVLKTLQPVEREVRGESQWFLARVQPYRTIEDHIAGIVLTLVDITEHKKIQEALQMTEERFRTLFGSMEEAFVIQEAIVNGEGIVTDYRYLECNPAFLRHTGLDDPRGRTVRELIPAIEPIWMEKYAEVLRTGEPITFQARLAHLNRWLGVSVSRLGGPGSKKVAILFSDITERKLNDDALLKSEQTLRHVMESAREYAIFTTDLDLNVTTWNRGAERILGFAEQEILGRNAEIIFTSEDRAGGRPGIEMEQALREGRASDIRWHLRKDGTRFWSNGFLMAMRDDAGATIGFVKILRDDTSARETQQELEAGRQRLVEALSETERARDDVEAASHAKDHFLAVLSHELRTPLAPIFTTLKMLSRQTDTSPQMKESLELIRRNIRIEAHLIDDLLDVTRIARGKLEIVPASMDLHEAIHGAVEITAADLEEKNQRLTVSLDAKEHQLTGDAARLQQAVWNLLKNASKFTPEGGELKISTRNESGKLLIEVSDTGIGIHPEALPKIFDAFAQGGEEVTRRFGGLGLGLAISKATVDAHGGNISATSAGPGQGSTFIVELPLGDPTN